MSWHYEPLNASGFPLLVDFVKVGLDFAVSDIIDFHHLVVFAAPVEHTQDDDAEESTEEQDCFDDQPRDQVGVLEGRDVVSDDEEGQPTASLEQEAELF